MKVLGKIMVCTHCLFAHEGDGNGPIPEGEPQPWALWDDTSDMYDITVGITSDEHADDCTPEDREAGCGCSRYDMSRSSCDGCGSTLHGAREAFTVFYREPLGNGMVWEYHTPDGKMFHDRYHYLFGQMHVYGWVDGRRANGYGPDGDTEATSWVVSYGGYTIAEYPSAREARDRAVEIYRSGLI